MADVVIDSHQHLWSLRTPGHAWPTAAEAPIHRDFGMDDLRRATAGGGLRGTVLVQSQPTDADTAWLLALAADEPAVLAVVGWADLAAPDAPARIADLAGRPKLRGLRPMLQSIDDTEWLLRAELAPALAAMQAHGLRLDALVQPRHLPMLARFMKQWPALPIVIDHAAKPFAATDRLDPWRAEIAALADQGAFCKLSGLRTEQMPGQSAERLAPYVEHLVACFGDRLMWGSDWPVLLLSGDDWATWRATAERLARAAGADTSILFAGAARRFYGLESDDAD